MYLKRLERAHDDKHKYVAVYDVNGREKRVPFGAKNYTDFTLGASEDQRANYIRRHTNDRENHNNPLTPAALSRHILWGETRSVSENLRKFRRKFNV